MEEVLMILVVLVPMMLFGVIGFLALQELVSRYVRSLLTVKEHVEMLRDVAVAMMFIGPAAGFVLGISESNTQWAHGSAFAAFWLFGWVARQLSKLLHDVRIEQEQAERQARARQARLARRQSVVSKKRTKRLKSR